MKKAKLEKTREVRDTIKIAIKNWIKTIKHSEQITKLKIDLDRGGG